MNRIALIEKYSAKIPIGKKTIQASNESSTEIESHRKHKCMIRALGIDVKIGSYNFLIILLEDEIIVFLREYFFRLGRWIIGRVLGEVSKPSNQSDKSDVSKTQLLLKMFAVSSFVLIPLDTQLPISKIQFDLNYPVV